MRKIVSVLLAFCLLCSVFAGSFVQVAHAANVISVGDFSINTAVDFDPSCDCEAQIWHYSGTDTVLDIPEYVGEYKITGIHYYVVAEKSNKKLHVEQINIPKTVLDIDNVSHNPFDLCVDCVAINADPENPVFASENGILYSKDKTKLLRVPCKYPGETLVIADGVKTICRGAIADCAFQDIEFPQTLEYIEQDFMEHSLVQELYFPDSLQSISALAFHYVTNLKYVYFGAGLQLKSGFEQISCVEEYAVSGANPYLSAQDGVLFNKDKTKLIAYPVLKSNKEYVVPDSVKTIGKLAFYASNLSTLHTNQVENVEGNAIDSSYIKELIFGEALKSITFNANYYALQSSVTFLSRDCTITISHYPSDKLKVYGYYGSTAYQFFYVDETIKPYFDFVLLDEEPELGFKYTELTNDSIRVDAFTGFDTSLEVPDYIDGKRVVQIAANCFKGNTSITELTLPQTLETIDSYAFEDLTKVETLTVPASVKSIGSFALGGMTGLKKLYINSFSCTIGDDAFPAAKIFACSGSTAESYATGHGLSFYSIGHQYVSEEIENNKIKKTCALCGYTEIADNPSIHHEYEAVVTEPTCTEQGYTTYTCSICGDSYITDYKAALGHDSFEIKATSPTCTVEGKTAGMQCARCSLILKEQEVIAKLPHEYDGGITTKAPTCISKGVKTYTCRNCDDFYTEELEMIAHDYVGVVKAPTCTEKGHTTYTCSYCSDSYLAEETEMLPHTPQEIPAVAATCTKEGSTAGSKCAVCGLVLVSPQRTEKTAHRYDNGTLTLAPTCQKEGIKTYRCQDCDAVYTAAVEKIAHDYLKTVKAPTCTEGGFTTYTCSYCRDTYQGDETAVLPHTPQEIPAVAATCTKEGSTAGSKCAVCGLVLVSPQRTEKTAHQYDGGNVSVSPTCQKTGVKTFRCQHCSDFYEEKLPKVEHNYVTVVKKAASFAQNGVLNNECSMCKALRKSTVVKSLKSINLSASVFSYSGKQLAVPKVTVKDSAGKTVAAKYYTITCLSRATGKAVKSISASGQYKVKVTFKGAYAGTKYAYFTVKPAKLTLAKPTSAKRTISTKWKKDSAVSGYQLMIATNKSFSAGKKVFTINKNTIVAKKITGLKSGKTYFIKVRSYKNIIVDGKKLKIYSDYSAVKTIKCK